MAEAAAGDNRPHSAPPALRRSVPMRLPLARNANQPTLSDLLIFAILAGVCRQPSVSCVPGIDAPLGRSSPPTREPC
jgi:hypothetical protein